MKGRRTFTSKANAKKFIKRRKANGDMPKMEERIWTRKLTDGTWEKRVKYEVTW